MAKMKTPKKKEVVKYFENAKEVACLCNGKSYDISKNITRDFYEWNNGFWSDTHIDIKVWDETQGYAKILSYKEPKKKTYEITKEQILDIEKATYSFSGQMVRDEIKKLFPEVFETKLVEFNKWVVTPDYPKWIVKYDKDNDSFYGLNINGEWFHADLGNRNPNQISNVREATEQEVTESLTKEAVRRGFKEGVYFKTPDNKWEGVCSDSFYYNSEYNILYCGQRAVFNKGQWAEIIPTITIQEAEAKLNCKIV